MSSPLYSKVLSSVEENMYNLGYAGKALYKWFGDVTIGSYPIPASLMNFTAAATPVAGDMAFIARLRYDLVAGNALPASMMTQSHASGYFAQGSFYPEIYFEAPDMDATGGVFDAVAANAAAAKARMKFIEDIKHIFRGQFGSRIAVYMCPTGTALALTGINGAVADSTGMAFMGTYLTYGRIAATGELG
jgi:hypothetical protein